MVMYNLRIYNYLRWVNRSSNYTIFHVEDFGGFVGFENGSQMLAIGVGNENLAEAIGLHEMHDTFDALGVKFIEDIVEKKNGIFSFCHL